MRQSAVGNDNVSGSKDPIDLSAGRFIQLQIAVTETVLERGFVVCCQEVEFESLQPTVVPRLIRRKCVAWKSGVGSQAFEFVGFSAKDWR